MNSNKKICAPGAYIAEKHLFFPKHGNSSIASEENDAVNLAYVIFQVDMFGEEDILDEKYK